jgi:flagellar assembly protein FliH
VEPTFSRAELDAARAAGHAEGRAEALAEVAQSTEQRAAAALVTIAQELGTLAEKSEQLRSDLQRQAAAAIRTVVRKAVPALCRREPLAEIEALLVDCLSEALDEPRIVLRVASDSFEPVQRRLASVTADSAYGGKIVLLADESIASGDCRIEWADGGAERNTGRLLADVDAALARLDSIPARMPPAPEETSDE